MVNLGHIGRQVAQDLQIISEIHDHSPIGWGRTYRIDVGEE